MSITERHLAQAITDREAPYLGLDPDGLAGLATAVQEAGYSVAIAQGIVGWLVLKSAGVRDTTAPPTRSKYRKILAELAADDGGPGRGQGGYADVLAVAGVTAAATAAALAPVDARASALLAGLVYITYIIGAHCQGSAAGSVAPQLATSSSTSAPTS